MKSTRGILFFIGLFAGICNAHNGSTCDISHDPFVNESLKKYKEAFNSADSNLIKSWSITQQSYDLLLAGLVNRNLTCLTEFDKTYSVRTVVDEFNQSCRFSSGYVLDSIAPLKASLLKGCGDVVYKKIDAKIFLNNDKTRVELPLSLVFLEDSDNNYKLMMQITNSKILQNEQ